MYIWTIMHIYMYIYYVIISISAQSYFHLYTHQYSYLIGDPVFESVARRAAFSLWNLRSPVTGLLGSVIDIHTGKWINQMSGVGAGSDSFYEYMLKVLAHMTVHLFPYDVHAIKKTTQPLFFLVCLFIIRRGL